MTCFYCVCVFFCSGVIAPSYALLVSRFYYVSIAGCRAHCLVSQVPPVCVLFGVLSPSLTIECIDYGAACQLVILSDLKFTGTWSDERY